MQIIRGLLCEPVGCLAEFPSAPFHEIAVRLFSRRGKASRSGSRSYWHLLNLMESAAPLSREQEDVVKDLELAAVAGANLYEDVRPALRELKAMGVHLSVASSLSSAAIDRFLETNSLSGLFAAVCSRDNSGGVKAAPLVRALKDSALPPESAIFLTDTAEGIGVARTAGVQPILMMNDPDEAKRLAINHHPAGGVVSLHELPDFVRLLAAQCASES